MLKVSEILSAFGVAFMTSVMNFSTCLAEKSLMISSCAGAAVAAKRTHATEITNHFDMLHRLLKKRNVQRADPGTRGFLYRPMPALSRSMEFTSTTSCRAENWGGNRIAGVILSQRQSRKTVSATRKDEVDEVDEGKMGRAVGLCLRDP